MRAIEQHYLHSGPVFYVLQGTWNFLEELLSRKIPWQLFHTLQNKGFLSSHRCDVWCGKHVHLIAKLDLNSTNLLTKRHLSKPSFHELDLCGHIKTRYGLDTDFKENIPVLSNSTKTWIPWVCFYMRFVPWSIVSLRRRVDVFSFVSITCRPWPPSRIAVHSQKLGPTLTNFFTLFIRTVWFTSKNVCTINTVGLFG